MANKVVQLPRMGREVTFKPETLDTEKRTVEVIFSTGASVRRGGYFTEPYVEQLDMNSKSIRLERFKNGASVLNSHNRYDLSSVLGVVEDARIENGIGIAKIRFSERADVEPIFQDVANGIIRNVSIGYQIHSMKEQEREKDGTKVLRAVDWEPIELSFVSVPADKGANVRSQSDDQYPCELILEENRTMPLTNEGTESPAVKGDAQRSETVAVDLEQVRKEAAASERKRVTEIKKAVRSAGLDDSFSDEMINLGVSADEARSLVIDRLAEKDKETATRSVNVSVGEDLTQKRMMEGAQNAILNRFNSRNYQLDEQGKHYRNLSMVDLAREFVEKTGVSTRGMSRYEIVTRGMHSTSDFPLLLANVAGKTLRDAYQAAPQTFMPITREVTVSDFKEVSRNQLGDAPSLEKVLESGEVTRGTIGEGAEKYKIEKYAKIVAVTREALVNDDLSAFTRLPDLFGRAARDLESDLVWAIITSNPVMSDTITLFHANHSNLNQGGAAAISVASLGKMRAAMRLHKGLNGRYINLTPAYLFVPPSLETLAQQYVASITPAQSSNVNPFVGAFRGIAAEPRLEANSATAWYMAADVGQIDIIELARLEGEAGPQIETRNGFEVEGLEIKVRMDVGAKAIDYRGLQKNAGA